MKNAVKRLGKCDICSPSRISGMLDQVQEKHLRKFSSYCNMDPGIKNVKSLDTILDYQTYSMFVTNMFLT